MHVTKEVITDLYPLYVERECSADTRALVEEYLQGHPQHAEELRRVMSARLPGAVPPAKGLEEVQSLREARRRVRRRSWLLGFSLFLSLTPLSVLHTGGKTYWLFLESPMTALINGALAVVCWIAYAVMRNRSNSL
jgi:ferric-dicitrate binding protein FerR (iron transport regulator)